MKFADITKSVGDAWAFLVPPIMQCGLIYLLAHYLDPVRTERYINAMVNGLRSMGSTVDAMRNALGPYGLTTLVPIVSFIAVVAAMYVLSGPILSVCANLPPSFFFRPDVLIARSASREELLLVLRWFPAAPNFGTAYSLATSALKSTQDVTTEDFWATRIQLYGKIQGLTKFALVTTLILAITDIRLGNSVTVILGKVVVVVCAAAMVWAVSGIAVLYHNEQAFFEQWRAIRVQMQHDSSALLQAELSPEETTKIETAQRRRTRWWGIQFGSSYRLRWLQHTLWP